MYYALPAWYVRTTKVKQQLLDQNQRTAWYPPTIKHGRYGDWLNNNVDWALSRTRYWGTPLPIWRNDTTGAIVLVGSLAELAEHAGRDLSELDPHRPFIDQVTFSVNGEDGTYRRVPDVIDAWYDSGAMPFAQWGYPHVAGSQDRFSKAYPADYICEAIDQTRGWFYSLMAVGTLVHDQSSYRNVVCLGHILAEDGRKMSKHLGNILLPIPLMDAHSADALRWFMACSGSPWSARLIGARVLEEVTRKVLLTYWNSVAFQALYGNAAEWDSTTKATPVQDRPVLDRWLSSETHRLVLSVTEALDQFDTQRVGSELVAFLDQLSNWYVRRSRRRFWAGDPEALATLHETLRVVTLLLAPITPFITERVWGDLFASPETPSVHLATWPVADSALIDDDLNERVCLARRIVELGRGARAAAKTKVRQPLRRAVIATHAFEALDDHLRREIAAELNVLEIESFATTGDLVGYSAKGNFRELGRRFGKQTPIVAAAIAQADAATLFRDISATGEAVVVVDGSDVVIQSDELVISERPQEGWSVVNAHGETVALDLELDDDLRRAGIARELVRAIQDARKRSGLEISDRIRVEIKRTALVLDALAIHATDIATEVLATRLDLVDDAHDFVDEDLDLAFRIQAERGPL
jgi:isoleucyl-tRNA synthetase